MWRGAIDEVEGSIGFAQETIPAGGVRFFHFKTAVRHVDAMNVVLVTEGSTNASASLGLMAKL